MRSLEDRFNKNYQYDWTFLNDVPFDQEFIEATTAMASGRTQYALIPAEDWNRPSWINETLFEEALQLMEEKNILYGGSKSYRNMCRFNSGFFFRQKILDPYDFYFRVEPDVEYFCDFPYDPFKVMRQNNKKYGFVITMYEYEDTIPSLWEAVEDISKKQSQQMLTWKATLSGSYQISTLSVNLLVSSIVTAAIIYVIFGQILKLAI
jgi:mannosyltransferase